METGIIGVDVLQTSTTQKFRLGAEATVGDATYKYVRCGSAALAVYRFVWLNSLSDSTYPLYAYTLTTASVGAGPYEIACPQVAFAIDAYGWMAIKGVFTGWVGASCVGGAKMYTTATQGLVDDAATTLIAGLKLQTTVSAANQNAVCYAGQPMYVNYDT